jgi:hypothetical protein
MQSEAGGENEAEAGESERTTANGDEKTSIVNGLSPRLRSARYIVDPARMRPSGSGVIEFRSAADCLAAFSCVPPPMMGRAVVLSPPADGQEDVDALPTRRFRPSQRQFVAAGGRTCYFENLPYSIGEEHIQQFVAAAVASGSEGASGTGGAEGTAPKASVGVDSSSAAPGTDGAASSLIERVRACAIKHKLPTRYTGTCFVRMRTNAGAVALLRGAAAHQIDGRGIKVTACWDEDVEDVTRVCCDVVDFSFSMDLWSCQPVRWENS